MSGSDRLEQLPHFPLEMVAFPGEQVNLHIFEPRYRQLIHQVDQTKTTFCIPPVIDRQVQTLATEVCLDDIVNRYEDGRLDIRVTGIGIVQTVDFFPMLIGWLYPGGTIERIAPIDNGHDLNRLRIIDLIRDLWQIAGVSRPVPGLGDLDSVFAVAHHIGLSVQQEYTLLANREELDRQQVVIRHLEDMLPAVRQKEEIRRKAAMNGHFRAFPPADWT